MGTVFCGINLCFVWAVRWGSVAETLIIYSFNTLLVLVIRFLETRLFELHSSKKAILLTEQLYPSVSFSYSSLISHFMLGEKSHWVQWILCILGTMGVALVVVPDLQSSILSLPHDAKNQSRIFEVCFDFWQGKLKILMPKAPREVWRLRSSISVFAGIILIVFFPGERLNIMCFARRLH